MKRSKITTLSFIDISVLTVIFFGIPILSSLSEYLQLLQNGQTAPESLSLDDLAGYRIMVLELLSLAVAWLYLRWRRFDFKVLNFSVNRYTLPLVILLVCAAGLTADIYQYLHQYLIPEHFPETSELETGVQETSLLWSVSLLNGFYEELFFMGLVFAVTPKMLPRVVMLSMMVRFLFHTYQGLAGALTITTLGLVFFLFRRQFSALVPFMLAHALFDVFGLSVLVYFYEVL